MLSTSDMQHINYLLFVDQPHQLVNDITNNTFRDDFLDEKKS